MITLATLENSTRPKQKIQRVGRGAGSGRGKTCCRGEKGAGSRSGYKRRFGYEGGQFPLYRKIPCRGFSNARFRKAYDCVNLEQIEMLFEEGEHVNLQTLVDRGFLSGRTYGIKLLGNGELRKKVTIEVSAISDTAREKLNAAKISYTIVN